MRRLTWLFAFLIIFLPVAGNAQAAPRVVAVMPFTGEPDSANRQFRDTVTAEIRKLPGNFQSVPQEIPPEDLQPDQPLSLAQTGGRQYAVTGVTSFEDNEYHLQLWLWDARAATLVYSDEMVCDELNFADEYIATLLEWMFSQLPPLQFDLPQSQPPHVLAVEESKLFQIGGRLGGSVRQYSISSNAGSQIPYTGQYSLLAPSFEAALHGTIQALPFLAFQAEAVFTMDFASFLSFNYKGGNAIIESVAKLHYASLMFPLLVKLTINPYPFLIAPYGGAYYIMPLGDITLISPWEQEYDSESLAYSRDLPAGWIAGLTLGMHFKHGLRGRLFADIRFSADLGRVTFDRTPAAVSSFIEPFKRDMLSVSIGYEVGFVDRK